MRRKQISAALAVLTLVLCVRLGAEKQWPGGMEQNQEPHPSTPPPTDPIGYATMPRQKQLPGNRSCCSSGTDSKGNLGYLRPTARAHRPHGRSGWQDRLSQTTFGSTIRPPPNGRGWAENSTINGTVVSASVRQPLGRPHTARRPNIRKAAPGAPRCRLEDAKGNLRPLWTGYKYRFRPETISRLWELNIH